MSAELRVLKGLFSNQAFNAIVTLLDRGYLECKTRLLLGVITELIDCFAKVVHTQFGLCIKSFSNFRKFCQFCLSLKGYT